MKPLGILAAIIAISFGSVVRGNNQATTCAALNWSALQRSDSVYADAMDFSRTLADRGFVVQCIAPSKMTGMFEGQVGAALYSTDQGGFDTLFLPKSQNFDRLQIIERQDGGRYLYSFAGGPKPWPANLIDASHPVYFIKNLHRLLVANDGTLAAHLRSILAG